MAKKKRTERVIVDEPPKPAPKALGKLVITKMKRSAVQPNDYNPNRQSDIEFEMLCSSMRDHGITQPIIVREDTMTIVDGYHRWLAAGTVYGEDCEIPVVLVPMDDVQSRIATFVHNRARGHENVELAAMVFRELQEAGALEWAAESLVMDEAELHKLIEDTPEPEIQRPPSAAGGARSTSGISAEALAKLRQQEKALEVAKTEEERAQIRRDSNLYRINLVFANNEAALLRTVLTGNPYGHVTAESVLQLCDAAARKQGLDPETLPETWEE